MRLGTALFVLYQAKGGVRRRGWDGYPEELITPGCLTLVWTNGGTWVPWHELGTDRTSLTYEDLNADDWELAGPMEFGTALKLARHGLKVRRATWSPGECLEPNDPAFCNERGELAFSGKGIGPLTFQDLNATDWEISDDEI